MKIKIKKSILKEAVRQILKQAKFKSVSIPAARRGMDLWNPRFEQLLRSDISDALKPQILGDTGGNIETQDFPYNTAHSYCDNMHSTSPQSIKKLLAVVSTLTYQQVIAFGEDEQKIWQWMLTAI